MDIVNRNLSSADTYKGVSTPPKENHADPPCPWLANANAICHFGAKINCKTNFELLLKSLASSQSEQEEKLSNFIDAELSWCPLRKVISLTHSALLFGTSWNRFKLICQDHWIAVLAAHKCIFSLDETQLKNLFEVRERIVAALSDSPSDETYLA